MPYPRRLNDDALARAKWEYENTPTSARELGRRYGLGKSALAEWVRKQGWIKYQPPGCHEFDAGRLTERRRIRDLLRDAEDGEIIRGLGASSCGYNELQAVSDVPKSCEAESSRGPAIEPGQLTKQAPSLKAGQARLGADTPFEAVSDLAVSGFSVSRSTKRQHTAAPEQQAKLSGCWERSLPLSPGLQVPPRAPGSDAFPGRTEDDQPSVRVRLAELRGTLTVRQITELERHEQMLADYEHLLCVYLAPHRFLDLDGLDEAARSERVVAVQKAALATLLPTERDTLAGALRTLTTSLSTVVQLKRLVAGLSENPGRSRNGVEAGERTRPFNSFDGNRPSHDLEGLDTETLRMIQRAMEALTGHQQRRSEPPVPPPPESLEDFRAP